MSVKEQMEQIQKQMAELKTQRSTLAKQYLEEGSKAIFEKYPELESFCWSQYTPYFNDGDACIFSANIWDDSIGINDYGVYGTPKEFKPMCQEISEMLQLIDEDDLYTMFDDHALVTVNRDLTIDVNHYRHD